MSWIPRAAYSRIAAHCCTNDYTHHDSVDQSRIRADGLQTQHATARITDNAFSSSQPATATLNTLFWTNLSCHRLACSPLPWQLQSNIHTNIGMVC